MSDSTAEGMTVTSLLWQRADHSPQAIAFVRELAGGQWEGISWQTFRDRADCLRRALAAAGLRKGDRLALIAPVSVEWELVHHAALSMGAVIVGLDTHDLPERIGTMVEQADVAALAVADSSALAGIDPGRLERLRFILPITPDNGSPAAWPAEVRVIRWGDVDGLAKSLPSAPGYPSADDEATIIFTSGTTGAPKGIAYTHGQLCLAINAICEAFEFVGPGSRLLCWLPLSNLFQRIVSLAGMKQGAATYLLSDPRRVMEVVANVSPDVFVGVPRFYEKLYAGIRDNIATQSPGRRWLLQKAWGIGRHASAQELKGKPLPLGLSIAHRLMDRFVLRRVRSVMGPRLQCMITGSAPIPTHLLHEFHALGWVVLEAYGLSENVLPMAMNRRDRFCFGSVGQPVAGNEIAIDPEGNVRVRGPGVFRGYLGEAPPARLDADGYYTTGDIGGLDSDGFLHLTGRSNDMIKTSTGRRIAPAQAEAALQSVAGIEQAILIGSGRKCLVAICTSVGHPTDGPSLRRALQQTLMRLDLSVRPSAIAILPRPFDLAHGELTPNLKLRRIAIETGHSALIDQLFARLEGGGPKWQDEGPLILLT